MNWMQIVEALVESGLTEVRIGELVGASQPTINRIRRRGTEPKHAQGERLIELHEIHVGTRPQPRDQVVQ